MNHLFEKQTLDEATATADRTVSFLREHLVPPTPLSYCVAYEYFADPEGELGQELGRHLQTHPSLDSFLLRDLYEHHLATDLYKPIRGMGTDLQGILQGLLQQIAEAGKGVTEYDRMLENQISRIGNEIGPEALQAIAAELLSATQAVQVRNQQLQQQLEATHRETETLRAELERHRREVLIDPLTGLYNRRAMEMQMDEFLDSTRNGNLAMLMLDIDHFKRINDTYGHAVGDIVIRNVADTIHKSIRGEDMAIRFGGEEFIVLLPGTTLNGALVVAEMIRKKIELLRLIRRQDNFRLAPFTISLGVAQRKMDDTQESLFQRADQALYHAKQSGRNRVSHENLLH